MTKMRIATYLGFVGMALEADEDEDETRLAVLEAVREAQLIMYELARDEMLEALANACGDHKEEKR